MVWTLWILAGIYTVLILQAFFWYKRINSSKLYISAERKTPTGSALLSAQMTATAIPLFLIIPTLVTTENGLTKGMIIGVSAILGTLGVYLLTAERLRIYSEITGDCQTVPSYLAARFKDSTGWLRAFSAALITVFTILLASYTISTAADIASLAFGVSRSSAAVLICGSSLIYLYMGGISASVSADRVRGYIASGTIIAVFVFLLVEFILGNNDHSAVRNIPEALKTDSITVAEVFSCIGVGLGFFGFPAITKRFLMIKERKPKKRFCVPTLVQSIVSAAGILLVSYIVLSKPSEAAFISEFLGGIENGQTMIIFHAIIDSLILVSFLAVLMAVTDGALLAAAATFSSDIFNEAIIHETDEKKKLTANRITVLSVGFAAFLLALGNETMPIMEPSFIWATFGACFGPITVCSLYCKRLTTKGAVASMTSGLLTVLIWKFILSPLGGIFEIYEMIPGFLIATVILYTVSLLDKQKPSARMLNEFGRMWEIVKMQKK